MQTPLPARHGTASCRLSRLIRVHPYPNTGSRLFAFPLTLFFLLSLIGLAGCGSRNVSVEEKSTQTIRAPGASRVIVQTFNGKVDIYNDAVEEISLEVTRVGVGSTQAEADLDLKNIDIQVMQEADTVTIIARDLDDNLETNSQARLVVRLPVEAKLNVTSGVGDINFWGMQDRGEYSFRTGSGSIHIFLPDDASLQVNALTGNGKIDNDFLAIPTVEGCENILNGATDDSPDIAITATTSNGDVGIHYSR